MHDPADTPKRDALDDQSATHLATQLRRASNRIEMLLNPDVRHHEDDNERLRIRTLDDDTRQALRRESLNIIAAIRAEMRRRSGR